jgi:hypothetical protein
MEEGRKKCVICPMRLCLWFITLYTDNTYFFSYVRILQLPFLFFQFLPHLLFLTFLSSVISRPAIERYILPSCFVLSLICENGVHHVKIYWTLRHTYSKEHSEDISHRSSVFCNNRLSFFLHLALKSLLQLHVGTVHIRSHSLLPSHSSSSIL